MFVFELDPDSVLGFDEGVNEQKIQTFAQGNKQQWFCLKVVK